MAVYSKYPIDTDDVRTFQTLPLEGHARRAAAGRPGHRRPPADWYSPAELDVFRLSSKSHWDLPHRRSAGAPSTSSSATRPRRSSTGRRTATAPATTTRSGSGPTTSRPAHVRLHLRRRRASSAVWRPGRSFVIAGDQNSDPLDGDSIPGSRSSSCSTTRGSTRRPRRTSAGAVEAAVLQGGANLDRTGRTRDSTPPTSPTARRATCAPTTCCRRKALRIAGLGCLLAGRADPAVHG